ncbi:hypothetical protein D3C73_1326670 [compost metagenome]
MPKSSSEMDTPRSFSARKVRTFSSLLPSSTDSVISSSRRWGARPESARASATVWTRLAFLNCTGDRLTDTVCSLSQLAASWHARFSARVPSSWISPVSSAMGMKSMGMTMPRVGCSQRNSAS